MRYEAGLGWKARPTRLNDTKVRQSPKVSEQLPEDRRIHRDTHWLPLGLARQPGDGGTIELPPWIFPGVPGKELVELAQGKLRAPISVSQAPLELQEAAQLAGDWTVEDLVHRGTGSPTPRRRFSATRT